MSDLTNNDFKETEVLEEHRYKLGYEKHMFKVKIFINQYEYNNRTKNKKYFESRMVGERGFEGKRFNPPIRYNVYIKDLIEDYCDKLLNIFTSETKQLTTEYNGVPLFNVENKEEDLQEYKKGNFEIKFVLTLNDIPIVEREYDFINMFESFKDIYFNEKSTYSLEFYNTLKYICDDIYKDILIKDIEFMWEIFYLIKYHKDRGMKLTVRDIKQLSEDERNEVVKEAYDYYRLKKVNK